MLIGKFIYEDLIYYYVHFNFSFPLKKYNYLWIDRLISQTLHQVHSFFSKRKIYDHKKIGSLYEIFGLNIFNIIMTTNRCSDDLNYKNLS